MIGNLGVAIPGGGISDEGVFRDQGVFGTLTYPLYHHDGTLSFHYNGFISEAQINEQVFVLLQ